MEWVRGVLVLYSVYNVYSMYGKCQSYQSDTHLRLFGLLLTNPTPHHNSKQTRFSPCISEEEKPVYSELCVVALELWRDPLYYLSILFEIGSLAK
jgi:hypothetical protein